METESQNDLEFAKKVISLLFQGHIAVKEFVDWDKFFTAHRNSWKYKVSKILGQKDAVISSYLKTLSSKEIIQQYTRDIESILGNWRVETRTPQLLIVKATPKYRSQLDSVFTFEASNEGSLKLTNWSDLSK